jgi:hypothetical protein
MLEYFQFFLQTSAVAIQSVGETETPFPKTPLHYAPIFVLKVDLKSKQNLQRSTAVFGESKGLKTNGSYIETTPLSFNVDSPMDPLCITVQVAYYHTLSRTYN